VERAEQLLLDERDAENLKFVEDAIERFPQDPEVRLLYLPFRASRGLFLPPPLGAGGDLQ